MKIDSENNDYNIKTTLERIASLILRENFLKFSNYTYKQLIEVPMGYPISNVVAEWKMGTLENIIRYDIKEVFRI